MAISSSVRKVLWAKSGNKCAFCQKELTKIQFGVTTICGEECHIVSQKPKGPRHKILKNYDVADNLILLCQEHHKMIDDNPEKFSEEYLKKLKAMHESKIKIHTKEDNGKLLLLTKVNSAKELVRCLNDAEQYATDYPTENEDDYPLFAEFFEWINNFDVLDECSEFKKMEYINPTLKQIQERGYIVVCGQLDSYGKWKLRTSFVFILTEEQYKQGTTK